MIMFLVVIRSRYQVRIVLRSFDMSAAVGLRVSYVALQKQKEKSKRGRARTALCEFRSRLTRQKRDLPSRTISCDR